MDSYIILFIYLFLINMCCLLLQLWPKVLRMTQILHFHKVWCFRVFRCFCQMSLWCNEIQLEAFHNYQKLLLRITQNSCNKSIYCSVEPSFSRPLQFSLACCQSPSGTTPDWWQCIFASVLGIEIWRVSWPRAPNLHVLFPELFGYDFCFMARWSMMLENAFFTTKLPFEWLVEVELSSDLVILLNSWPNTKVYTKNSCCWH